MCATKIYAEVVVAVSSIMIGIIQSMAQQCRAQMSVTDNAR